MSSGPVGVMDHHSISVSEPDDEDDIDPRSLVQASGDVTEMTGRGRAGSAAG